MTGLFLLGAGFLLGRMSAPERKPDAPEETVERAPAPASDAPPLLAGRPVEERHVAPAETMARLREIVEALPIPEVPTGNGVIVGSVRASDGHGVAGVELTLVPVLPSGPSPAAYATMEPAEILAQGAVRQRWTRAAKRTTTTGEDGTYRFEGVADLDHDLNAKRDGYRISLAPSSSGGRGGSPRVRAGQTVDFTAQEIAEVEVDVRLPDGRQASEATITFQSERGTSRHGWRPANNVIRPEPGRYEAFASGGPGEALRSEKTTVTLEGAKRTALRFDLGAGPAILVRVRFPEGEEVPRPQVAIARVPEGGKGDPALLAVPLATKEPSETTVAFDDLRPGRFVVGVQRTQQGPFVAMAEVEVGAGPTSVDLVVPPLRREEYVVLRAVGPSGEPIPTPEVSLGYYSDSTSSSYGGGPAVRRPDGSLWILHGVLGEVPRDARRWIRVASPRLGSRTVEYGSNEAPDLVVRFQEPVTLAVTLRGVPDVYAGRVQLRVDDVNRRQWGRQVPIDRDGKAWLEALQPGRQALSIVVMVANRSNEVGRQDLDVAPGMEPLSIAMPPLYQVTLVGVESGWVSVNNADRGGNWFSSINVPSGSDRVVVDALPAGEYQVQSTRRRAKFSLPGPEEVELR